LPSTVVSIRFDDKWISSKGFVVGHDRHGRKEYKKMKNGMRWGWVVIVVAGLLLTLYYLGFPFWPPYFFWGGGYRSFGPRIGPAFPLFGLLVLIVLGFVLVRLISPSSGRASLPPGEGWTFCPYCGGDLRQGGKAERTKGDKGVSLPRT
jgi:hypothetical protein